MNQKESVRSAKLQAEDTQKGVEMRYSTDSAFFNTEMQRFQRLLSDDPAYAYRRCGLSLLYSLPGEPMIDELTKFGWKPQGAQDLYNLGARKSQAGNHKEALKYYEMAVETGPEHWRAFFNLALTYKELNDTGKAHSAMQKCVKILEDKRELYNWEREDLEQARRFLEEV